MKMSSTRRLERLQEAYGNGAIDRRKFAVLPTEILGMLNWAGFGLKSRNTKQSGLIHMVDGDARFSPMVSIAENTATHASIIAIARQRCASGCAAGNPGSAMPAACGMGRTAERGRGGIAPPRQMAQNLRL